MAVGANRRVVVGTVLRVVGGVLLVVVTTGRLVVTPTSSLTQYDPSSTKFSPSGQFPFKATPPSQKKNALRLVGSLRKV